MIQGVVGKGVEYTYYTPAEAKAKGIDYLEDWRSANEEDLGKWILSDTGFVVGPLLYVYTVPWSGTSRAPILVRIPTGTFYASPGTTLTHEERESRFTISGKPFKRNHSDPTRPLTQKERRFVAMFTRYLVQLGGAGAEESRKAAEMAYLAITNVKDPKKYGWRREARRFSRRANVEQSIANRLGTLLDRKGITEETLIDKMWELATKGQSEHVRKDLLRDFCKMRGISLQEPEIPLGSRLPNRGFAGYSPDEIKEGEVENSQRALSPGQLPQADDQ